MTNNTQLVSLKTLLDQSALKSEAHSETSTTQTGKPSPISHETKLLVNRIFARFHHLYTHRFESAYSDETMLTEAKREWAISISGIDEQRIVIALERCKIEHAWPPTIAEFFVLLEPRPEDYGLPNIAAAYAEAVQVAHSPINHRWSNPAVQIAAQSVSYFTLRSESEKNSRALFKKSYLNVIERLINGETLTIKSPKALIEPDHSAARALAERLKQKGIDAHIADQASYYLEKPEGTDVRKRYREHSEQRLNALGFNEKLPE